MKLKKLLKKTDAQNIVSVLDREGVCIVQGHPEGLMENMDKNLAKHKVLIVSASRACLNTVIVTLDSFGTKEGGKK